MCLSSSIHIFFIHIFLWVISPLVYLLLIHANRWLEGSILSAKVLVDIIKWFHGHFVSGSILIFLVTCYHGAPRRFSGPQPGRPPGNQFLIQEKAFAERTPTLPRQTHSHTRLWRGASISRARGELCSEEALTPSGPGGSVREHLWKETTWGPAGAGDATYRNLCY